MRRGENAVTALTAFLVWCTTGCSFAPGVRLTRLEDEPSIRVAVATDLGSVVLSATSAFDLSTAYAEGQDQQFSAGTALEFRAGRNGMEVGRESGGAKKIMQSPCRLVPSGDGVAVMGGKRYRGSLEVVTNARGRLTVINEVGIEDYLRGVVPNEIPHGSLDLREAVKAQTVAARTYAIAYRGQYAAEGYDLLSTVMDQVYSGVEGESEITDRAIRDTRGVVASFQGEAIQTNYSSTCGGHTADRHEVWDKPPLPYLKGVSDKGSDFSFCSTSKYFRWEEGWGGAEFLRSVRENLARENGTRIDSTAVLKDVHVVERGKSGRVKVIEFRTDKGNFRATGDRIRWAIQRPGGAGPLRSTLFDVHAQKDHGRVVRVTLRGRGWGHGVGMCQWGAMERSRQGQSYAQILHHYYRGIRLMTLY